MAVIPDDYAQANFKFGGTGVPSGAEVTLGLSVAAGSPTPATIGADLIANWMATIATVMPSSIVLEGCLVKFGPNDLGPSAEVSGGGPGTGGGAQTSIAVAILVQKLTAIGGRPGRGRMFIPGAQESEVAPDGTLSGAFVAGLQSELNTFYADMVTNGIPPYLLHSVGSPLTTPTAITSFQVQSVVATQRRRQRR